MAGNRTRKTAPSAGSPRSKSAKGTRRRTSAEPLPEEPEQDLSEGEETEEPEQGEEVSEAEEPSDEDLKVAAPAQLPAKVGTHDLVESDIEAVSPSDPLRRYLEEVRHYPLLAPEDEFQLAMQLKEKGDLEAAKRLVTANLRLVVKIAFEYRSIYSNLLDLIQEGNIGLMKAVSKFDPTKGARLGYYASWWIRSYILKYLLDNFRLVKIGTTQAQKKLFYHLLREKERLEAQGLLAGPKLLAERLDVREKDVVEMEQRLSARGTEMPLDAPIGEQDSQGSRTTHMDLLADNHENADQTIEREQLIRMLEDRIPEFRDGLNEKERRLLDDRLLAEEPKTLQEVADLYGLTRERARQIEAKVIQKLREFLAQQGWPVDT